MPYAPERKQQTRERIVGAAARLFNRRGFAEVTIGEIMTAAGLSHGGFYRHFRSKDELHAEAVRHFLKKEVPERWQKGLADACLPDQRFARFVVDAYVARSPAGRRRLLSLGYRPTLRAAEAASSPPIARSHKPWSMSS